MVTDDVEKCTGGIKGCIALAKTAFNRKQALLTSKWKLNLRTKTPNFKSGV